MVNSRQFGVGFASPKANRILQIWQIWPAACVVIKRFDRSLWMRKILQTANGCYPKATGCAECAFHKWTDSSRFCIRFSLWQRTKRWHRSRCTDRTFQLSHGHRPHCSTQTRIGKTIRHTESELNGLLTIEPRNIEWYVHCNNFIYNTIIGDQLQSYLSNSINKYSRFCFSLAPQKRKFPTRNSSRTHVGTVTGLLAESTGSCGGCNVMSKSNRNWHTFKLAGRMR